MAKKQFRITESDFLLANRKASREEEIARFGKQIIFRTTTQKSKKVYDRKRLKKADIKNNDDLPFLYHGSSVWTDESYFSFPPSSHPRCIFPVLVSLIKFSRALRACSDRPVSI